MKSTKSVRVITEKTDAPRTKRMVVKTRTETTEVEAAAQFPLGAKVHYYEGARERRVSPGPEHGYGGRVIGHDGSVVLIRRYGSGSTLRYDLDAPDNQPGATRNTWATWGLSVVEAPLVMPRKPSPKQVAIKAERKAAVRAAQGHLMDLLLKYGSWKDASPAERKELAAADQAVAAAKKIGRRP